MAKPTEYNPGTPLERYSAERRRRGVATESAGYTAGAIGTASGASMVGNAKIAGTKIGQHSLGVAEHKLKATGHPGAAQVARVKRIGASAAKHKVRTNVALGGLTVAAGALGVMGRMRANEEAGISQGIGRIKAGESYANTRHRTLSKGAMRTVLMLSDTDVNNPALRKTAKVINEHGGKILGGTAATGVTGGVVGSAVANKNRAAQARSLRHQSFTKALYAQESRPSLLRYAGMGIGGGLAAWGLGRSGMLGAALGRGVKAANVRGNTNALEALRMAQATQGLLARHTAPGERQLRQIRALNTAINRVPSAMRPEIAAASGIYLMGSSTPLNRTSYRQVSYDRRAF